MFLVIALFTGAGCVSAKKTVRDIEKRANSSCDLAHLGKNKLFYKPSYHRKLEKSNRKLKNKLPGKWL